MKRLFIAVATLMFSFSAFAQDLTEGAQAKNAGNEAYRNKEFVKAIENQKLTKKVKNYLI